MPTNIKKAFCPWCEVQGGVEETNLNFQSGYSMKADIRRYADDQAADDKAYKNIPRHDPAIREKSLELADEPASSTGEKSTERAEAPASSTGCCGKCG